MLSSDPDDDFSSGGKKMLPRLIYIGDVPVESSYHGSALLYRLLASYPPEKLQIVEGNLSVSKSERRLRGVDYKTLDVGNERLLRTRLHNFYSAVLTRSAPNRARSLESSVGMFSPEAVLTVTHGYSWMTAARFAAQHQLPLHLICHDDWPRVASLSARSKRWVDCMFGKVYRQATSRLCVSPGMEESYRERYGAKGEVLYPSRNSDSPLYDAPPERLASKNAPFTIAFAGTINSRGYMNALVALGSILKEVDGRLLIFGPLPREEAARHGLACKHVELRGLVPSSELIDRLREEADVLFVPMSFDERERPNMESSFPSKLADYTAAGLPLLIQGPPFCSAIRWASQDATIAEIVTSQAAGDISEAVKRLMSDSAHRWMLGKRALEVGERDFSAHKAREIFYHALGGPASFPIS